jgi:carbon-monoxide dehydrogenase medium subunit
MFNVEYREPATLREAIELLAPASPISVLVAGGTDLLVDLRRGRVRAERVVSLAGLEELKGIRMLESGATAIGALVTVREVAEFFAPRHDAQALSEAARLLGSRQIQNAATIGGNLCKASPGADLAPPLLCLDAVLTLCGPLGTRQVKIDAFFTGPGRTTRGAAEVLTSITLPPLRASGSAFLKIMRRRADDLSIASACARVQLSEDGQRIERCAVALGAVAPVPFLSRGASEVLTGSPISTESLRKAAVAARGEARPITDVRASAEYRLEMVEVLVRRAVQAAAGRAGKGIMA